MVPALNSFPLLMDSRIQLPNRFSSLKSGWNIITAV